MFQYFLKVVATQFRTDDGKVVSCLQPYFLCYSFIVVLYQVNTHQYSTTSFGRDLKEGIQGDTPQGIHMQHGVTGVPGNFLSLLQKAQDYYVCRCLLQL